MTRRFASDNEGSSTVEFVIFFPFLIALCFAGVEFGWLMTRFMIVERSVDVAMREVRLGGIQNPTYDELRDRICDTAGIIATCEQNLVLTTQVIPTGGSVDPTPAPCFDRLATEEELEDFNPADGHNTGGATSMVVIKICAVVDPILKNPVYDVLLGFDESGGFRIRTTTAFLHEPY
ncbi:MAG: TadE/TadG family type IV pilus assembly protein [Pseudomonadota bacterium]